MAEAAGSCCCRPSPPLSGLGVGQAGRAQAILGPWTAFLTVLGGAGDVAFGSGNPSWAAVLGRLLPHGEVYPCPPARPAQQKLQASLRLWRFRGQRLWREVTRSACCPGFPIHMPLVTGPAASCLPSQPPTPSTSVCSLEREEEQEACTPTGFRKRPAASLLYCCWLLTFQDSSPPR